LHVPTPKLVLIPGLGADAGLYAPQRAYFGDRLIVPPWIDPLGEDESLASYARRLGETIDLDADFWIGGYSFGGMLAAEIAEARAGRIRGLFMIGACTHRSQIRQSFRTLSRLAPYLSTGCSKAMLNRVVPRLFAIAERVWQNPAAVAMLDDVAFRTDVRLLQWGAPAIRSWRPGAVPQCPTFTAHGAKDTVIPPRIEAMRPGVDLLVPDGRHLIGLTHAPQVNAWIDGILRRDAGQ
jgi:pimeloyl-ACP methyl ester carboxylesterase